MKRGAQTTIYMTIGDALSNTRSALDHLTGALAVRNGHSAGSANFPIAANQERFEDKSVQRIEQKLGKDAWAIICGLKPYRGGNDLFWALNTLRNKDTHETVVPVASAIFRAGFNLRVRTVDESSRIDLFAARFDEKMVARIIRMPTSVTVFDGDIKVGLGVAFANVATVEGEPVVAILQQFLDLTRRTVVLFEERFFG
ncbi:hypothetical protein ACVIU7_008990 [Bradyrhizobium liaoningense]|nr:hypothetical protein GCM10007858_44690 [Bradyrhizobium liaoningense]